MKATVKNANRKEADRATCLVNARRDAIAELGALSAVGWSDLFGVMERLSPRQIEVMLMLDDGMSMADISRKLKVTQPRVHELRDVLARKVKRARRIVEGEETIKAMTHNEKGQR